MATIWTVCFAESDERGKFTSKVVGTCDRLLDAIKRAFEVLVDEERIFDELEDHENWNENPDNWSDDEEFEDSKEESASYRRDYHAFKEAMEQVTTAEEADKLLKKAIRERSDTYYKQKWTYSITSSIVE